VLFGFGIRSALVSGTLAARSILENRSYDELWRERLLPHLKASVVNRMLYGGLGDIARRLLWRVMGEASHPCRVLRRVYGLSPVHRIFYPFCREARSRSARAALVGSAVTRS
jgi:flavin-dependent dehydrogenase